MSINTIYIILLVCTISLYFAKYTSFSPVYFFYLLAVYLYTLTLFLKNKFRLPSDSLLLLLALFVLTVFHYTDILTGSYVNFGISVAGYTIIRSIKIEKINILLKYFKYSIYISVYLLIIDTIYRLLNPSIPNYIEINYIPEDRWFYLYKYNSILFRDSNTSALIALSLFFSTLALRIDKKLFSRTSYILTSLLLVGLIILSFSRASIIGFLLGLLYYFFLLYSNRLKNIYKYYIYVCVLILFSSFAFFLFELFKHDPSFLSKLLILKRSIDFVFESDTIKLLFGIGLQKSKEILGIYTHNLFITAYIEGGFIFGVIFSLFFIYVYLRYPNARILLVPVFITSMSYYLYLGAPFLFVPLSIIVNYEEFMRRKKGEAHIWL